MTDHEAELDPIVPVLSDADPLERYGEDGGPALRLIECGALIRRALAMSGVTKPSGYLPSRHPRHAANPRVDRTSASRADPYANPPASNALMLQ